MSTSRATRRAKPRSSSTACSRRSVNRGVWTSGGRPVTTTALCPRHCRLAGGLARRCHARTEWCLQLNGGQARPLNADGNPGDFATRCCRSSYVESSRKHSAVVLRGLVQFRRVLGLRLRDADGLARRPVANPAACADGEWHAARAKTAYAPSVLVSSLQHYRFFNDQVIVFFPALRFASGPGMGRENFLPLTSVSIVIGLP